MAGAMYGNLGQRGRLKFAAESKTFPTNKSRGIANFRGMRDSVGLREATTPNVYQIGAVPHPSSGDTARPR